jgi:hypothetical protein
MFIYLGYGHNFYLNGFAKSSRNPAEKRIVIKASVQLCYTQDDAFNNPALLGRIENLNKSIEVFGKTAGPTYSVSNNSRYGSSTQTYTSRTLDIAYAQDEWAVMPRLAIASNPYLHGIRWELAIGYNIPLAESGGLFLYQDDGNGNSKGIAGKFSLSQPTLTFNYNNQPTPSAPYRFSNYYIGFTLSPTHWRHRPARPPSAHPLFGRRRDQTPKTSS